MPKNEAQNDAKSVGNEHEWIKIRLKEVGKKAKDIAEATGQPASRISEKIKGKRDFQIDEIPILAQQLELPVSVVLSRLPTQGAGVLPEDFALVDVNGAAQAGKWMKAVELHGKKWDYVLVPKEAQYPFIYALRVLGDDMDAVYPPENTVVLYTPYEHYQPKVKNGDHVVVQRADGNGQFEVTIKEVKITKSGRVWLEPRSTNAAYTAIEVYRNDNVPSYYGSENLKITGVVLKALVSHQKLQQDDEALSLPETL